MTIAITAEAEAKIREKVASGRYASADQVIGEALRLLDEHEQAALERLRALIDEGDEGEGEVLTRESWDAALERVRTSMLDGVKTDPDVARVDAAS